MDVLTAGTGAMRLAVGHLSGPRRLVVPIIRWYPVRGRSPPLERPVVVLRAVRARLLYSRHNSM